MFSDSNFFFFPFSFLFFFNLFLITVSSDSYNGNSTELYSTFVDIEESTNIISTDISSLTDNLQSKTRRAVSKLYKSPTGENNPLCDRFSVGDIYKRTIYSPGFPGFYPNNTDCVVVLEGKAQKFLMHQH